MISNTVEMKHEKSMCNIYWQCEFTVNELGTTGVIWLVIKGKSQYLSPRRSLENLDLVKLLSQLHDQRP